MLRSKYFCVQFNYFAELRFCLGKLPIVVKHSGEAMASKERVGILGSKYLFFQRDKLTKTRFCLGILAFPPERILQTRTTPERIAMVRAEHASANFNNSSQYVLGFRVPSLIERQIGNGVLHFCPLSRVALAPSQLLSFSEVLHRAGVFNSSLSG